MLEEILTSTSIRDLEDQHGAGTYYKRSLVIVRGDGARLWDETGREYIDCVGGQGAANIGHQNSYVNRAIQEQSQKLINCTELFYNDQRARLLEKLSRICPPSISRFFLCNSGAETVEGLLDRVGLGRHRLQQRGIDLFFEVLQPQQGDLPGELRVADLAAQLLQPRELRLVGEWPLLT